MGGDSDIETTTYWSAEPVDTHIDDKRKRHNRPPRQDEIESANESPFHSNILMQLSGGTEMPVNCKDHPDDTVPKVLAGRRSFDYEFGSHTKSRQTWCSANKKIMLWILLIFVLCILLGSSIWAFITYYPYFYGVSNSIYFNVTQIPNATEPTNESTGETEGTTSTTTDRTSFDSTTANIPEIITGPATELPYFPEVPRITREVNIFAAAQDKSANIENQSRIRREFDLGCEFRCQDGSGCFPSSFQCDNAVQCKDASDERDCSCPDRLEPWKLCDGFPDCPDREDELGCYGCSKNQFSCAPSLGKGCYNTTQRCDGTSQCLASVDETDCIRLDSVYDNTDFAIIERNMNGKWYPVCIEREADSFEFGEALNSYASLICKTYNGEEAQMSAVKAYYPSAQFDISRSFVLKIAGNRLRGIRLQQNSCKRILAIKCSPRSCATVESSSSPQIAQFDQSGMLPSAEKIVGGRPAMIRDWPWIVAVFRNGTHICGGVILNSRWILTAAHCFNRHFNYFYEIQAGMVRRLSLSPYEQTRFVTHIIQERGYSPTNLKNDIALAYVEPPLKLNKFAAPVCLAEEDFKVEAGTLCNVAGWGSVNETGYLENIGQADLLQEVSIPIVSICKNSYNDPDKEICAGAEGKDSCQGDSGSPLLCPAPNSGNMLRMVGLVSHGKGCARETSPGVYTKVASYRQWIDNIISKDFNSIKYSKQIKALKINKCPGMTCKMSSGSCLHPNYICDKQVDCFDGSDELNCTRKEEGESKGKSLVIVTPVRRHRGICSEGYRECLSIKECVPQTAWCDRHLDCHDKSDENECTCGHYIWRLNPHRFCDGIVDCADFSDETGCDFNCKPPSFFCPLSRQCLSNVTICNRRQECPLGEDELFCLALSKEAKNDRELQIKLDEFGFPIRSKKGFVSINTKSVWEQLCAFDIPTQKLRNATCQYLGFGYPVATNLSESLKEQLTPVLPLRGLVYSGSKYMKKSRGNFDPKKVAFQQIERRIDEGKGDIVLQGKSQNISDTICGNLYLECSSQPPGIRPLYNSNRGLLQPQRYNFLGRGLWPWHMLLLNKGEFICDATLVDVNLAIVGLDCISKIRQPTDLTIAGGLIRKTLFSTPFEQIRNVAKILFFERFVILEAGVPFEPTMDINPLKLQPRYAGLPNSISRCFITRMVSNLESYLLKFDENLCKNKSQPFCFSVKQPDLTAICRTPLQGGAIVCSEDSREWYLAGLYETNEKMCYENDQIWTASRSTEVTSAIYSIKKGKTKGDLLLTQVCETHRCIDGKCLVLGEICDGKSDCRDASDEPTECKYHKYCASKNHTCSCDDNEFVCGDGRCISLEKVCDGVHDCSRGDDENDNVCHNCTALVLYKGDKIGCHSQLCKNDSICSCDGQFNCYKSETKECINKSNVCDGTMDCWNGEDEDFCVGISSDKTERGGFLEPSGYLMVQIKGSWYTYCDEGLSNISNPYCEVILGSKLNEVRHFEFEHEESCTKGLAKINCAM